MTRPALLLIIQLVLGLLCSCASEPRAFEIREIARGNAGGVPVELTHAFQNEAEFRAFAKSLHSQYPQASFPIELPGARFGEETILAILAGDSEGGSSVRVARVGVIDGRLLVVWRKVRENPDRVFVNEDARILNMPSDPPPRCVPYLIFAIPAFDGPVRFLQNRALLDGP